MRKRRIILHFDGTVTCWRATQRDVRRIGHGEVSAADLRAMTLVDRERFCAAHPPARDLIGDRSLARVRLDFILVMPLGDPLPSPTLEAVESAALAIAGPVAIGPGARVSVQRTRLLAGLSPGLGRPLPVSSRRPAGVMIRSLDQGYIGVSCSTGHPETATRPMGYMSLKEAGAGLTILAYECTRCHRRLYVTEEVPVARVAAVDTSAHDDVE